ncbi:MULTISPECIES: inovirus Gp2 family protein [unclassified Pseudomonas]|uniref:inovirus Gp2 family protein n=1 Tax=unclassified Pseudomonas TaxID=196821 RepID=UPI0015A2BE2D|nr:MULTISPECIES: inovirus Gp2 family protein [unclassified Pseudomonas]NWC91067.1 inovirus Gp2 family protein [Pseudomonas sp. IPO3779]NWD16546.1 inovirus Gp2 family protein [Pseudomonas sp. IPO3778]
MHRHPTNTNLSLHYGPVFLGKPIQVDKGPFIQEYLSRLDETIQRALEQYSRVFAFRVDLRLPTNTQLPACAYTNQVIDRFMESFKDKIRRNRRMALLRSPKSHGSCVRYVWAREIGQHGLPHYHLVILLNRDAFTVLGNFKSNSDNIFHRLESAWASALRLSVEAISGAVHIPDNPVYYLDRGQSEGQNELFKRASYLCKAATKVYGDGNHAFGASRL